VLVVLIGGGAWVAYQFLAKPAQPAKVASANIRTVKVTTGPIKRVLRLTGSTTAKNFAAISAPRIRGGGARGLVLMYLVKSGAMVKKGDVVARIDAQAMNDSLNDLESQIYQANADLKKKKADIAVNWENLQQTLRASKAQADSVKLDAAAGEIRTPIDAEELKLSVEEADSTYKEQLTDLQSNKISAAADLRVLEISQEISIRQRDRYKGDIEKFTIEAPMSGLAVMRSIIRGTEMAQVQLGDQVAPGQPFMMIVDPNGIQVLASASQVESEEMRLGQTAVLTFDAFPDLRLNARVSNIGAIAIPGATQNYFLRNVPVYLTILDHDSRVIPDLTTSSDVVVNQVAGALLIPRSAIESKNGKTFVHVKRGEQYETREVKLGPSDNVRIAVLDGVREGEEVVADQSSFGLLMASN
jgi:multidrug efflux pump subunit AcrA (membrane-fusion protein)